MASSTQWTWVWIKGRWLWTGRPGVLQSMGSQSWTRLSDWTELISRREIHSPHPGLPSPYILCPSIGASSISFCTSFIIGEGNGNPLQCACLENPRDGEPAGGPSLGSQSRTRLKRLSSSSILKWCSNQFVFFLFFKYSTLFPPLCSSLALLSAWFSLLLVWLLFLFIQVSVKCVPESLSDQSV